MSEQFKIDLFNIMWVEAKKIIDSIEKLGYEGYCTGSSVVFYKKKEQGK